MTKYYLVLIGKMYIQNHFGLGFGLMLTGKVNEGKRFSKTEVLAMVNELKQLEVAFKLIEVTTTENPDVDLSAL